MPKFKTFRIPDDYSELSTPWMTVTMCVPNCAGWRRIVDGAIYNLTRGRNWDERTGTVTDAQAVGVRIWESLKMDCNQDLTRIADSLEAMREIMGPLSPNASMLGYMQELQALGGSVAAGDTIMVSLQRIVNSMPLDMTLQELIDEVTLANDPTFKDFLEMLTYWKQLTPNLPSLPLGGIVPLIGSLYEARHKHTHSTAMVMQAQFLRQIANALTAFKDVDGSEEESTLQKLWNDMVNIPWLHTAIVALVDPSPAGETAFIAKIVATAKTVFQTSLNLWANFRDSYINQIVDPMPKSTVTGQLAEIAARIQNFDTGASTGGVSVDLAQLVTVLTAGLADINQSIEEDMSVTQVNNQTVNCNPGGSAAYGGCSGSTAFIPDQSPCGTAFDQAPYNPASPNGLEYQPAGFEDYNDFVDYKCKAANAMVLNLAESVYQIYEQKNKLHDQTTHSLLVQSVKAAIISTDFMFGTEWLYSFEFYDALVGWEAETISDYLYNVQDTTPFNLFYDLRLEILANREAWVCAIFNGATAGEIEANLNTLASTFVSGTSYDQAVKDWALAAYSDMLSSYWLNIPFIVYDNIVGYSDSGSIFCLSSCVPSCTVGVDDVGIVVSQDEDSQTGVLTVAIQSEYGHSGFNPNSDAIKLTMNCQTVIYQIISISLTGWTDNGIGSPTLSNLALSCPYNAVTPFSSDDIQDAVGMYFGDSAMYLSSGTPFTGTITLQKIGPSGA